MNKSEESNNSHAFEEFKLFYESAEKVTDRRLSANRWNYSICTAMLIAIAGILNWGLSKPSFFVGSIIVVIIIGGMAVLFCSFWIRQIDDFKKLNNAKFDILNRMAPSISFATYENDKRVSFSPFEKEWDALKEAGAVHELSKFNLVVLKSSNIEYLIPQAFRILFFIIILLVLVGSYLNWEIVSDGMSLKITPPKTSVTTE